MSLIKRPLKLGSAKMRLTVSSPGLAAALVSCSAKTTGTSENKKLSSRLDTTVARTTRQERMEAPRKTHDSSLSRMRGKADSRRTIVHNRPNQPGNSGRWHATNPVVISAFQLESIGIRFSDN